MKKILIISIISILVYACSEKTTSSVTKSSTIIKTESASVTHEQFLNGKLVYEMKCGTCHKLKDPARGNMTQWTKWIDRMAPKAKLTEEEKNQVTAYVSVNASEN